MSSGRKITFLEPDPQDTRRGQRITSASGVERVTGARGNGSGEQPGLMGHGAGGHAADGIAGRGFRRGSPYPWGQPPPGRLPEIVGGAMRKFQDSVSSIASLGCHRSRANSESGADEGDESLQRYKESLGLGAGKDLSDPNDPRVCIIQSLTMESPGRDPVIIDLTQPGSLDNLKKTPFKIKEGATFTMSATFKVQHEILSGLHYVQVIKRKGIRIPGGKTDEMIVRDESTHTTKQRLTLCDHRAATPRTRTRIPSTPRNVSRSHSPWSPLSFAALC